MKNLLLLVAQRGWRRGRREKQEKVSYSYCSAISSAMGHEAPGVSINYLIMVDFKRRWGKAIVTWRSFFFSFFFFFFFLKSSHRHFIFSH